jgi:CDP-diacylglycerol---glycerol-3-phosphate 3-phosphatidyltransferase
MILTLSRLALAGAFAASVAICAEPLTPPWALGLIALALVEELTDLLDGIAARHFGTASTLGGLLDPLSDSLARLAIYFAMALVGWVTIAVPLVMTARDVIVAYTRTVQALGGGKTSARLSGKIKAVVQGGCIPLLVLLAWRAGAGSGDLSLVRNIATGALLVVTLWSLGDYVRGAASAAIALHSRR